jgi:hypothetical protein
MIGLRDFLHLGFILTKELKNALFSSFGSREKGAAKASIGDFP